jgi:hypothetical protein
MLGERTGVPCALTNLARDGASVEAVLARQLPADLVGLARQRLRQASDIIREQAGRRGAVCLDAWAMLGAADPRLFGPDRIHPNASGHQLIADTFAALLLR